MTYLKTVMVFALMGAFGSSWAAEPGKGREKFRAQASQQAKPGRVYFIAPKNNDSVDGEFTVKFGVEGMAVRPAGEMVAGTGHHHLILNGGPIPAGQVIPADDRHLHFGKGQTEAKVKLPPGKHTLTLQFADGAHLSYGDKMSATITVNIKGGTEQ